MRLLKIGRVCVCACFQRMLTCTWREDARNLMWTEFVPLTRAEEELCRAERDGDAGRAAAIRKALEARRAKDPATCTTERDCESDGDGGGMR